MSILLVALGSGIGGACRYLVGLVLPMAGGFPWATLCVNVLGSLVLGAVSGVLLQNGGSAALRAFAIVGFCGGFTTFSTSLAADISRNVCGLKGECPFSAGRA